MSLFFLTEGITNSHIICDTELNTTSKNALTNKAVTEAFASKDLTYFQSGYETEFTDNVKAITFDVPFSVPPFVLVSPYGTSASGQSAWVTDITDTGCTIHRYGTVDVAWLAMDLTKVGES